MRGMWSKWSEYKEVLETSTASIYEISPEIIINTCILYKINSYIKDMLGESLKNYDSAGTKKRCISQVKNTTISTNNMHVQITKEYHLL